MRARARQVLAMVLGAAAVLARGAPRTLAQGTETLPAPTLLPSQPGTLPSPTPLGTGSGTLAAATPLAPSGLPSPPPPDLEAPVDPGRNGWGPYGPPSPDPGFSLSTELALIHPVLRAHITNLTPLQPSGDSITLPNANLNWTVAPWFDVGYRLPRSLGMISVNYRFFGADGTQAAFLAGQPFTLRSRLDENFINIDYDSMPYEFAPHWDFHWRAGLQLADIFFDSGIRSAPMDQASSSHFRGAGPHARLDLERHLVSLPGLALFGRIEGSAPNGRINQNFAERLANPDGTTTTGHWNQNGMQIPIVLFVQLGLSYVPPGRENLSLYLGYTYERWFSVAQVGDDAQAGVISNATSGGFDTQGVFLRGRWDF